MKVPRLTLSRPWRSGSAWTRRPTSTRQRWPSCASCCRSRHHSRSLWPAWPGFWREKRVWSWFCWPGQERIWLRLNPVGSWRWGLALRSSKSLLHPCKVIGPNVFSKLAQMTRSFFMLRRNWVKEYIENFPFPKLWPKITLVTSRLLTFQGMVIRMIILCTNNDFLTKATFK